MSTLRSSSLVRTITTPEVNREFVLAKCDYFVDVQLWPIRNELDPESWLSNFSESEAEHATHLLNAFMYFSESMVEQLFLGAFHDLSRHFYKRGEPLIRSQAAWRSFLDNVIITRVTGEAPSDTDSGFIFVRMARELLDIPEERILSPGDTLRHLILNGSSPVVFVDDFVGSGNQFSDTWNRLEVIPGIGSLSFALLSNLLLDAEFFYCPLIATEKGFKRLRKEFPDLRLHPTHVLSTKYSAFAADSVIWPKALQSTASAFLEAASLRAGVEKDEIAGFHDLGLTLAFAHGVPDATLPLFYSEKNGWKRLVKRKQS